MGVGIPHSNAVFVVYERVAPIGRSGGEIEPSQHEPQDSVFDGTIDDRDVLIRRVRSSDLQELEALDGSFDDLTYPYFVLRQLYDVHQDYWLVADHPAGLLGYALGAPGPDRGSAWLLGHVVGTGHRRRGHGRALAQACMEILRAGGVNRVYLTVRPTNTIAIKLYETIGFCIKSLCENYLGPGQDRLLMELDL